MLTAHALPRALHTDYPRVVICPTLTCAWTVTVTGKPAASKRAATAALVDHCDTCEHVLRARREQAALLAEWVAR